MSIKILVAGMGHWGKNLVRNFDQLGVLHSVYDLNPIVKDFLTEKYPTVKYHSDFEIAIADKDVQAVALATPAISRYQMTKKALEAGKDVFLEKPLSTKVSDGQKLVELAEKNERILMVGHILQYHSAINKLKQLIGDGDLGQVRYLYSDRLNIAENRVEKNILWSFAPDDISVMLYLLHEEPLEIACQGGNYLNKGTIDLTLSKFSFPGSIRAHIFVSWLHPFKEQRLVVMGSKKIAVFVDAIEDKLKLYPCKVEYNNHLPTEIEDDAEVVPIDNTEPLKMGCEHFIECIVSRRQPCTDGKEGLRVLKILDKCKSALEVSPAFVKED